jgi:hypothetical protein
MEHVTFWNLLMLIPPMIQAVSRAYVKAKTADPNTLKPAWKTSEFWVLLIASLTGAAGTIAGGQ